MAYANRTVVPVERSRSQITTLLEKHKASRIMVGYDSDRAMVGFVYSERVIRFTVLLPPRNSEQRLRQRWRALLLALKAKLECVESGIETFEEAFLAHVVVPGTGRTVGEDLIPRLSELSAERGPAQLPGW